jgi:anti-anti-sigma factor
MLTIEKESIGPVDVVQVKGRVDGFSAPQLDQALQDSIKNKRYHIVVDLAETDYLSSAGMRALLHARNEATQKHGDVRLANLSEFIHEALNLVAFDKLFKIYDSRDAGVKSF